MDGIVADLKGVCDLADKYEALVMVDECHAAGFIGKTGRGSVEALRRDGARGHHHRHLGQGLGWGPGRLHHWSQGDHRAAAPAQSRPYLFSNSLAPSIVGASIAVLDL
jgi:glycine C-acetyltransferase